MRETISTDTIIGQYSVTAKIGEGGMGEVYRALDTRLDREVAIKVLPADFTKDADRLKRFEQEARATSALNHPNILTVYDIGSHEGCPYIVAELLEGEELRDQLRNGAIAQRKALDYAQQIASGLAAAHSKAIVHRDLKPENIFITTDGRVKILDFGLAKLTPPKLAAGASSEVATQNAITDPGTVMGTVGYMSPEQVRGQQADHRSDIFSFGVILYEMLSGKRTFTGESAAEVMNAIAKEEPAELAETNSKISSQLEKIVRRCLEKKPERRFQTASDLGFAIESLAAFSNSSGANRTETLAALDTSATTKFGSWRGRIAWIVAGVLAVIALTLGVALFRRPAPEIRASHVSILPPKDMPYTTAIRDSFAVSPDGSALAFTGSGSDNRFRLWVRPLDSREARPLAGTEGAIYPFWSPDSRSLAFTAQGKLKRIDLASGRVQTLCNVSVTRSRGSWSRSGVILISFSPGLHQIPETGGEPKLVIGPGSDPCFLPDGRHFLYHRGASEILVGSLDSTEGRQLPIDGQKARYAPPGWLLYVRGGSLLAQPFDADSLELKGEPTTIANQIDILGLTLYSVSETGVLVWREIANRGRQLVWFDREGKQGDPVGPPISDSGQQPALSPDGKRVALQRTDSQVPNNDIWVMELSRNLLTRITTDPQVELLPDWSPDGSHLIYYASRGADTGIYQKAASGTGNEELLLKSNGILYPYWSADGRFIIYTLLGSNANPDIWVLPQFGDHQPYPIIQTEFNEGEGKLSPDGRWIVYTSDLSGAFEIYVQPFTADGKAGSSRWRVSTNGGAQPRFSRDGKELFYIATDNTLMSVMVKSIGLTFEADTPKPLFRTRLAREGIVARADYEVAPDGQRFLLNVLVGENRALPFNVTLNWMADLKK